MVHVSCNPNALNDVFTGQQVQLETKYLPEKSVGSRFLQVRL